MTDAPFIDAVRIVGDDWENRTVPLSQLSGDKIFMVAHHSVSRTLGSIEDTFASPNRTVTANLAIGPAQAGVDDYKAVEKVPIDWGRAYTTASWVDNVALTFEMANLNLLPPYPVGDTGKEIVVEIILWLHKTYGMPMDRWHVTCHQEIYARGWGSYATACPGGDLHAALDWCVAEANRRWAEGDVEPEPEEIEMGQFKLIIRTDAAGKETGEWMLVCPGTGYAPGHDPADAVQAPVAKWGRQKGYRVSTDWDMVSQLWVPIYGDAEPLIGGADNTPYVALQRRVRDWDEELIRAQRKILGVGASNGPV